MHKGPASSTKRAYEKTFLCDTLCECFGCFDNFITFCPDICLFRRVSRIHVSGAIHLTRVLLQFTQKQVHEQRAVKHDRGVECRHNRGCGTSPRTQFYTPTRDDPDNTEQKEDKEEIGFGLDLSLSSRDHLKSAFAGRVQHHLCLE